MCAHSFRRYTWKEVFWVDEVHEFRKYLQFFLLSTLLNLKHLCLNIFVWWKYWLGVGTFMVLSLTYFCYIDSNSDWTVFRFPDEQFIEVVPDLIMTECKKKTSAHKQKQQLHVKFFFFCRLKCLSSYFYQPPEYAEWKHCMKCVFQTVYIVLKKRSFWLFSN